MKAQHSGARTMAGERRWVGPLARACMCACYGCWVSLLPSPLLGRAPPIEIVWTAGDSTLRPLPLGSLNEAVADNASMQTDTVKPHTHSPTPRTLAGEGMPPTTESVTTPILGRARKLAGLWVTADNGQAAYLEWMEFCEDWARHRLKQTYFERPDVNAEPPRERVNPSYLAWWEWVNAPDPPPRRTSAQLDQMAHDICEEAWDQGRNLREVLVALVRRLQQGALLPAWFYQVVVRHNAP